MRGGVRSPSLYLYRMAEENLKHGDVVLYQYNYKTTFKGIELTGFITVTGSYGNEAGLDKLAKKLVRQTLVERFLNLEITREPPIKFRKDAR